MVPGQAPTGLLGWIQQYGAYVQFIVQVAFWLVMIAVAIYAVLLLRRLVNARVASLTGGSMVPPAAPVAASSTSAAPVGGAQKTESVAVDEFVE